MLQEITEVNQIEASLSGINLLESLKKYLENFEKSNITNQDFEKLNSYFEANPSLKNIIEIYNFWKIKQESTGNIREEILRDFSAYKNFFKDVLEIECDEDGLLFNFDQQGFFYQSLIVLDDERGLILLMRELNEYLLKLASKAIEEDQANAIKLYLNIFPSNNNSSFACLNGTRERIQEASFSLFEKNIIEIAIDEEIRTELKKIFSQVRDGNQIHIFCCLLDSLLESREIISQRDNFYLNPQIEIEFRQIYNFVYGFKNKLIQNLLKRIDEIADAYQSDVYDKILMSSGELIKEDDDYSKIYPSIITPFIKIINSNITGIKDFKSSDLFSTNPEYELSYSMDDFKRLKTKSELAETLKDYILTRHESLFDQTAIDYSQYLIDPAKIFIGDEENGYFISLDIVEELRVLFTPINDQDSMENKIIKLNRFYAGLMIFKLINQKFIDSNPYYGYKFIKCLNFSATSFKRIFDNDESLAEKYPQFENLVLSIEININRYNKIFENKENFLQLYLIIGLSIGGVQEDLEVKFKNFFIEYCKCRSIDNAPKIPNLLQLLVETNQFKFIEILRENNKRQFIFLLEEEILGTPTALQIAVKKKNLRILKMFLEFDSRTTNKPILNKLIRSQDLLFESLDSNNLQAFLLIIDYMKQHLVDNPEYNLEISDILNLQYDEFGLSVLEVAVAENYIQAVKELIDLKANINQRNFEGITPFITAILSNNIEMVKLMIASGQDLEFSGTSFDPPLIDTPLFYALFQNHEIADLILKAGVVIDSNSNQKSQMVAELLKKNKIDMVQKLIDYGYDLNNLKKRQENFISLIFNLPHEALNFLMENGLEIKEINLEENEKLSYFPYREILDSIEYDIYEIIKNDPNLLQEKSKFQLVQLIKKFKTILQYDPNIVIYAGEKKRIAGGNFKEFEVKNFALIVDNCSNREYLLALSNHIINKCPNHKFRDLALEIKDKIKSKQDVLICEKTLIADNFINSQELNNLLEKTKLDQFIQNSSRYSKLSRNKSSQESIRVEGLSSSLEQILLTLKFICTEQKKEIYLRHQELKNGDIETKNIFLENFLSLIDYQGDINSESETSQYAISLFHSLDLSLKEFIITQIDLLKQDKKSPIIEFIDSQTSQNLTYFSSLIAKEDLIANPQETRNITDILEIIDLIDQEFLSQLTIDNPKCRDSDDIKPFSLSSIFNERLDRVQIFSEVIAQKIPRRNIQESNIQETNIRAIEVASTTSGLQISDSQASALGGEASVQESPRAPY